MTDHCVCERCQKPGSIALFRSPSPIAMHLGSLAYQGEGLTHAIALCVSCGQASGFPRFFDAPPAQPRLAGVA